MSMIEEITEHYPESLVLPAVFNSAILGMVSRCGMEDIVCYDYNKVIYLLIKRDGLSHEEAVEHFEFNIIGSYVGDYTPCFLNKDI